MTSAAVNPQAATQPPLATTPPRVPPGPPRRWWGLPLVRALRRDYLGFVQALQRQHGDVTGMWLGPDLAVDVFDPELVRALLVDHAGQMIRWERGIEVFAQLFGQSVLITEGATWQRQRRMLQPAFSPKRVAGYAQLMQAAAGPALAAAVPPGQAQALVDMDALFTRVAMDVILRTLFGTQVPADTHDATQAVKVLSQGAMREMFWPLTLPDWLPLPGKAAKRHALRTLRGLVARHIDARRAVPAQDGEGPQDLLAMLLALRDEATGQALSAQEVFDQCMVSFQAGHETSATALLWWSRLMAEHPQAAQRAQAEVDAALAGRAPQPGDLPSLPWLTATLKEALRLYPPIPALMTRRLQADVQVGGWLIPRRSVLRITPYVLQRDPRAYDRPDVFLPQRFLPDAPPPPRGAWMPFGVGPRVCLGQHFAMLEMTLVAAMLLQRYTLALPAGAPPAAPEFNVTLRPQQGLHLLMMRRETEALP